MRKMIKSSIKMDVSFYIADNKIIIYVGPYTRSYHNTNHDDPIYDGHIYGIIEYNSKAKDMEFRIEIDTFYGRLTKFGTLESIIDWLKKKMNIEMPEEVIDKFNAQIVMDKIKKGK